MSINIETISESICNFERCITPDNYKNKSASVINAGPVNKIKLAVKEKCRGNVIQIGKNSNAAFTIKIVGNSNYIFIGDNCNLNGLTINIKNNNSEIYIGNGVTCSGNGLFAVGQNSNAEHSNLLVGDDVMMAKNCSVFTSDNHPIYDLGTGNRINEPKSDVIIESHVWLGQGATINKSVTVGACSIIGAGSLVTKNIDRFSLVGGVPAKLIRSDVFWSRNSSNASKTSAYSFIERFKKS